MSSCPRPVIATLAACVAAACIDIDDRAITVTKGAAATSSGGLAGAQENAGEGGEGLTSGGASERGGVGGSAGSSMAGEAGRAGTAGNGGRGAGGDGGTPALGGSGGNAGAPQGGTSGGTSGGASAAAGSDAGAAGATTVQDKPQCASGPEELRTVFVEDFESYTPDPPYEQMDAPWIQAVAGRDGRVIASAWAHAGAQSFMLDSYTTRSEVAYVALDLQGPPRRLVIEQWYTPNGAFVYEDFAEFGLGDVHSKFDIRPSVAFEVNFHTLEFRAQPEKPVASSNGQGPYTAATKPAAETLFEEAVYAACSTQPEPPDCPPQHNYFRVELDFCADSVHVFAGSTADAPEVGSAAFEGWRTVNAYYLAGGLNPTYVDDIVIRVDD